jgi:hypothetical protein
MIIILVGGNMRAREEETPPRLPQKLFQKIKKSLSFRA